MTRHGRWLLILTLVASTVAWLEADTDSFIRIVSFQSAPSPYVVIPVPIKGQGCASLLFDTGTNLSIIDPDLAARLTTMGERRLTVASSTGQTTARARSVTGIGFELTSDTPSSNVVMADVAPLRDLVGNVNGIFGQSLLGQSDFFVDYQTRRLTLAAPGKLITPVTGVRIPLEWSEGRPAIILSVRRPAGAATTMRLVLDSGIDRLTLFGHAARRLAAAARAMSTVKVEGPLGVTTASATDVLVTAGDRDLAATATLMTDVTDRQEDGLLPTSLFRSVYVSVANGVVVLNGALQVGGAAVSNDCGGSGLNNGATKQRR